MLPPEVIILRLGLAAVLGLIVGIDRSRLDEAAGLRTHALVALGACLFMIVSAFGFADILGAPAVALDPSRIAAQVVTGIGFLGAGTIIVQRELVKGLTTAASVWAVAAVGLAVGGGLYLPAASATILILVILVVIKHIEPLLHPYRKGPINLVVKSQSASISLIRSAVEQTGARIERVVIQPEQSRSDEDHIEIWLDRARGSDDLIVAEALRAVPGVRHIETPTLGPGASKERTVFQHEPEPRDLPGEPKKSRDGDAGTGPK